MAYGLVIEVFSREEDSYVLEARLIMSFESNQNSKLALLIIAYLRPQNLENILKVAVNSGVTNIYISVDAPRVSTLENIELSHKVLQIAKEHKANSELSVNIYRREENVGCTPSVLSSCDWVFSQESDVIVLEDDCIPTEEFFDFCRSAIGQIQNNSNIWLACGTQITPSALINEQWLLSKYPLTWGWCTTKSKWQEIRESLLNQDIKLSEQNSPEITPHERTYWNAGSRRALEGISDAWDTPLVHRMLLNKKLAILPKNSLVSNLGNDSVATHTHGDSTGIAMNTGAFLSQDLQPVNNLQVEGWLRANFYRISRRHLISTRVTLMMDRIWNKGEKFKSLKTSWENAEITLKD
jgi:hypothetical protein